MMSPLAITGQAWRFYRSQPLLNQVTGWLFILPLAISFICEAALTTYKAELMSGLQLSATQLGMVAFVVQLLLSVWIFWGYGATLIVGERIVKSKAGRSRSSIQAVYKEGRELILPLFLTNLIRDCISFLYALPYFLVVIGFLLAQSPEQINGFIGAIKSAVTNSEATVNLEQYTSFFAVFLLCLPLLALVAWYRIKTSFFHVIVGLERVEYRQALKASKKLLKGKFWTTFLQLFFIGIFTFMPALLLGQFINATIVEFDSRLVLLTSLIDATATGIAMIVYILATIFLYQELSTSNA